MSRKPSASGHQPSVGMVGLAAMARRVLGRLGPEGRASAIGEALRPVVEQFRLRIDDNSRLRQTWTAAVGSGDESLGAHERASMIAYSRRLNRTTPLGAAFKDAMVREVVGTGIYPRGDTPESRAAADLFWEWADTLMGADIRRLDGFGALQASIFGDKVEAGDVAVLRVKAPDGHPFGIALQVIEAERILHLSGQDAALSTRGGRIVDGVQVDGYGRIEGIHIAPWNQNGSAPMNTQTVYQKSAAMGGAAHLLAWRSRPGQTRGMPMLAPVMNRLAGAEEFVEAVEVAAKLAACLAAVIKSNSPAAAEAAFRSGTEELGGPMSHEDTVSALGGGTSTTRALAGLAPGGIVGMLPDEDVKQISPTQPSQQFEMFLKVIARFASGVSGIPVEVVMNDFTQAPFSVARMATLLAQRTAAPHREQFVRELLDPVFRWFVRHAQALGKLPPGDDAFAKMVKVVWVGPKRVIVDPAKEAAATAVELDQRLTTMQAVHEERNQDWERIIRQCAKEEALMKELGVQRIAPPGSAPAKQDSEEQNPSSPQGGPSPSRGEGGGEEDS